MRRFGIVALSVQAVLLLLFGLFSRYAPSVQGDFSGPVDASFSHKYPLFQGKHKLSTQLPRSPLNDCRCTRYGLYRIRFPDGFPTYWKLYSCRVRSWRSHERAVLTRLL